MAKMKVVGFREVNFKDEKARKNINGVSLYVNYQDENVNGMVAEKIFVSAFKLAECGYAPAVGDTIQFTYNKYGKCDALCRVDK